MKVIKRILSALLPILVRIYESEIGPEYDDELSRKIDLLNELIGR